MKSNVSRRSVLAGAGCAVVGSAVGQLLAVARAQEAAQTQQGRAGGICLSMVFEDGSKVKFDTEKYVKNHLPLLREVYGDSVERIEVLAAPERDPKALIHSVPMFAGIPAPRAATTLWIKDVSAFGRSSRQMPNVLTKTWMRCRTATAWYSRAGSCWNSAMPAARSRLILQCRRITTGSMWPTRGPM